MRKGSIAGLMLCFTVSMLKARLSNCATDKMLKCGYRTFYLFHVWTENFCCIFAPKVAFSNLCGIVSTTHQSESTYLEIARLHQKGAIQPCHHEAGEFISPVFTRPKKDDSFQMTLNLKSFNTHVTNHHFKMDIWTVIRMMKPGCYMASRDLKDAYYSVPRRSTDQKFLKFEWKGTLYQFLCFPNGLALCSQKFTKLFKPFFSYLRLQGHIVL